MIPNLFLADMILSPGHFTHFLVSSEAREQIVHDLHILNTYGIFYYLQTEYPEILKKSIIINIVEGGGQCVDGNRHALTLYLFKPDITLGYIYRLHPCIRFWEIGYERDQPKRHDVWIPLDVETELVADVKIVTDYSKNPSVRTKSIPANIRFDSEIFAHCDRGRKISEAGNFLKRKLQTNFT